MVPLPPPDATFSLREAARLAGVTLRTVRYYVAQRALPKVKAEDFKGADTRYDLSFVLRLRAIATLLPEMRRLEPILARFDAASPEERVRLAGFEPPPAPPPVDPPREEPSAAQVKLPPGFAGAYRAGLAYPAERWDHVPICPGVVLLVKAEADAEAQRVAREMVALFGKVQA